MKELLAILISALAAFSDASAQARPAAVLEPGAIWRDRTQAQYVQAWWQWALSMPASKNPMRDFDGKHCQVGQAGDVWFLAGVYAGGRVERRCTIPTGKALFFPLITVIHYSQLGRDAGDKTCAVHAEEAAVNNEHVTLLTARLDGQPIPSLKLHRVKSGCFAPFPGSADAGQGSAAADGYWLLLRPLPAGRHTLSFLARYDAPGEFVGTMHQDVSYVLDVE